MIKNLRIRSNSFKLNVVMVMIILFDIRVQYPSTTKPSDTKTGTIDVVNFKCVRVSSRNLDLNLLHEIETKWSLYGAP